VCHCHIFDKISAGITQRWAQDSVMRHRWLTALAMARPWNTVKWHESPFLSRYPRKHCFIRRP
jgi:hypothetical protein